MYSTTSIIEQRADGSVLLSDGHGAEIRMAGGRMTITAPLDIHIMPGRDLIEWVPRNRLCRAGEPGEIRIGGRVVEDVNEDVQIKPVEQAEGDDRPPVHTVVGLKYIS